MIKKAFLAIGLSVFLLFAVFTPRVEAAMDIGDEKVKINVLYLNYNPNKLQETMHWSKPDDLSNKLRDKLNAASNHYLEYDIKEKKIINAFPVKEDGFVYTMESYLSCVNNPETCHAPDAVDYAKIFADFDICNKDIDEVWLWGGPWFGYDEYRPVNYCGKTIFVMGFNYERQLGEAIEDFAHRMESVAINRVNRGLSWDQDSNTEWNKFSQITGFCGNAHYPPGNTVGGPEYIYDNKTKFLTVCDGYLHYPTGPFTPKLINCDAWHCTSAGYFSWWLNRIPNQKGISTDQSTGFEIYNNWWKYWAFYDETYVPPTPGEFSNLWSSLIGEVAQFYFSYSGFSPSYEIDISTTPDMSWDVYLGFGSAGTNPVKVLNPTLKWDKYVCGSTLYWKIYNLDRSIESPIQTSVVRCRI